MSNKNYWSNICLLEIEPGSVEESSYKQNPTDKSRTSQSSSTGVIEVEGQNSLKENNYEYTNEYTAKYTQEENSDPDLRENDQEMGSEGQMSEGLEDLENQDESVENDEIFVKIKKFREKHDRSPDFSNSEDKEEIIMNREKDGMLKDRVTEEDFPSPFIKNELDMNRVEEVFDTFDNNVKETTVLYKPDEFGNVRVERYTQTKHDNGIVTTEYNEFHEVRQTVLGNQNLIQSDATGQSSEDGDLNSEGEGQNFEEYDQRYEELRQGNTGDCPALPSVQLPFMSTFLHMLNFFESTWSEVTKITMDFHVMSVIEVGYVLLLNNIQIFVHEFVYNFSEIKWDLHNFLLILLLMLCMGFFTHIIYTSIRIFLILTLLHEPSLFYLDSQILTSIALY